MSDWLIHTLLATSGLALLVLLVREPVRKRFGSRVTYGLWLIPAARLFMPTLTHTVERSVPAPASFRALPEPLVQESLWMARVTPADPSLFDRLGGWPTLLLTLWLGVALALFISRMVAFRRDRRAVLDSSVELARLGSVRIVRSPEVLSPVALGILDRVIALPADFDRLYEPAERRLVLEHELAHHRSGDLLANLFAFVLLCLQWFSPLAWIAHAAFRFDQEAACDARVLDKTNADGRADYGRAIAKAASGRALLFASALDHRNSLHRRLQSMLRNPSSNRSLVGRVIVLSAIAVALPLTASHAIDYVETPEVVAAAPAAAPLSVVRPTPTVVHAAAVPVAALAVQAAAPVRPAAPTTAAPVRSFDGDLTINEDRVTIDGVTKRWEDLTPSERTRVAQAVAKARADLANVHIDRARIMRDIGGATSGIRAEEIARTVTEAQRNAAKALRGIDQAAPYLRAAGEDPEQIKASVAAGLRSAQSVDVEQIRRSLASIDPEKIGQSVTNAQESVRKAQEELDRIDARLRQNR